MQDKIIFDPEKITLIEFKMVKALVDTPENFDTGVVTGHQVDNSLQFGFNIGEKLARADFTVSIKTETSIKTESDASGNFHLLFIYHIENLEELTTTDNNDRIKVSPVLANALASLTYSTSRGILLTRLQGTALQSFVLPVINPNKLLRK